MKATKIMTVLLGRPTVLLEELIMFPHVSFALDAITMLEAECTASFIQKGGELILTKKTIEKDQRKLLKKTKEDL